MIWKPKPHDRKDGDAINQLDRLLHQVRFEPRPSFEPELLCRLRRGELPDPGPPGWAQRGLGPLPLILTGLAIVAGLVFLWNGRSVVVDRCCFDLDGGGRPDDGVRVLAQRDGRVYQLSIYEDLDRSGTRSEGDVVRLERRNKPVGEEIPAGLTTIRQCCHDLDGGGPPDDWIVVVTRSQSASS